MKVPNVAAPDDEILERDGDDVSLKPTDLVEYLEGEGELGPAGDAEVWPDYDTEAGDLHLVDWRRLFGSERQEPLFPDQSIDVFEGSLLDEIGSLVGQGPPSGESEISAMASRRPDVCAWYQPIHFHGLAWGDRAPWGGGVGPIPV